MNIKSLTYKSIAYYKRYYKLVAIAALISVTVIVGSLVIGNSVRKTLVNRVNERLGDTEIILFSRNSYLSANILKENIFSGSKAFLLVNGFISQDGKLIPVYIWGTEESSVAKGEVKINPTLAKELGTNNEQSLVLRLPSAGLIPSGSLFVTQNYTTSLRLSYSGVVDVQEGGNISMKNEQIIPYNVFVNREELAESLELSGKVNLILDSKIISADQLAEVWDYTVSGLSIQTKDDFTDITSDRIFLQNELVESVYANNNANRIYSYLANSIDKDDNSIPYSFVTAVDQFKNRTLKKDEIILSDYSANRIKASVGDQINISYYTSKDLKTLITKSVSLKVSEIIPLSELVQDSILKADFPGLSDAERCTDWDSDLPIDMDLITDEDEKYWELYKNTPKAILPYQAIADDWINPEGSATAIRLSTNQPDLSQLNPDMFGIQLIYPKDAGIYAALNGVDFSGLFMALGFFIIISAMLLMLIPLSEMLYARSDEITLLRNLGYPNKRISHILWRESAPIVIVSSVIGVITGLIYTGGIMWLLGNVWKGATHTEGFTIYPTLSTMLAGLVVGVVISLILVRITIKNKLREKKNSQSKTKLSLKTRRLISLALSVISMAIIALNFFILQSVTLFVVIGILVLGVATLWGDYIICSKAEINPVKFDEKKLVWKTIFANKKPAILSFLALSIGVFIVFSVGLNRKGFTDSSQLKAGTGGYSLWMENSVPIYHNLSTKEGRSKLGLGDLPENTEALQFLKYSADDASCLNLNKVSTPSILGIDMSVLLSDKFTIAQSLDTDIYNQIRHKDGTVIPALVDATVLTWSLGKSLGDTIWYKSSNGQDIGLRLTGTLPNTIFQGYVLIDSDLFKEAWPDITGSEVSLFRINEEDKASVSNLLSQALNEYGVRVTTTNERLKQFNTVTDTYLTIFLTLGCLGLLLGIMSFIIVIRKNLAMRRKEIDLYDMLGYTKKKVEGILFRESIIVPLYAIVSGIISAIIGVTLTFMNTSIWVWITAFLFAAFFVVCVLTFVRKSVRQEVLK